VPKVTLVHKTNVLTFAGELWSRVVAEVRSEYPQVEVDYNHVDAACIYLVEDPRRYSVIVTDNLFGDILSDLAARSLGDRLRGQRDIIRPSRARRCSNPCTARRTTSSGPIEPIRWRPCRRQS